MNRCRRVLKDLGSEVPIAMIISLSHGFIFAAMPKTASSAFQLLLATQGDLVLGRTERGKHLRPDQIQEEYCEFFSKVIPYEDFVSFGVVRQPVNWLLSWYNFRARSDLADASHPNHRNYTGNMSFSEFIEEFSSRDPRPFARLMTQSEFYGFDDCTFGVRVLLRHERLIEDMVEIEGVLPHSFRDRILGFRRNRSPARITLSDVDADQRSKVDQVLARDAELYRVVSAMPRPKVNPPQWLPELRQRARGFISSHYRPDRLETMRCQTIAIAKRLRSKVPGS
jgi:hypothetical protein